MKSGNQTVPTRGMTDVDCKLTVLVAACTLCGFCLLLLAPPPPSLPLSLFSLSASRLSYSFSAGKVKCCLLPVRSEGAQGNSAAPPPPPRFVATMLLAASSPALPPASGGSNSGRPGCRGMCLSPVVSSLLSSSQLLQVDLFSPPRRAERGPRAPAG